MFGARLDAWKRLGQLGCGVSLDERLLRVHGLGWDGMKSVTWVETYAWLFESPQKGLRPGRGSEDHEKPLVECTLMTRQDLGLLMLNFPKVVQRDAPNTD
jgi:hypothetical protein